jgi:DNA ligase (NAD+)
MVTLDQIDLKTISIQKLGEILLDAKKAYYTGAKPIMDDHTYDTLEESLRLKSPHHRFFTKVGTPNFDTGFDKKKHLISMGSQNKVSNFKDLVHYFELKSAKDSNVDMHSISYVVEPKCDGISLEIIYKDGELVQAITRGDGFIGDVITQNVIKMKNFVFEFKDNFTGSVRCEIVMTEIDFQKLNNLSEEKYSYSRNAVSGISQRLDNKYSEHCSLYAVDVKKSDLLTETNKINYLKSNRFTAVENSICQNFDQIEKIYQDFLNQKRKDYPFEIDGLVIKINNQKEVLEIVLVVKVQIVF